MWKIRISLIVAAIFLLNGCYIARQRMVLNQPYYPTTSVEQKSEANIEKEPQKSSKESGEEIVTAGSIAPKVKVENKRFVQRIPFPELEYKSLPRTGNGVIEGDIYLVKKDGTKIIGRNASLYLNPVTSYSTQWYKESYLKGAKMSPVDKRLYKYLRYTTSDSKGHFIFERVPTGSYYLIGSFKCSKECGFDKPKSVRVVKKISIVGDEKKIVDLSKSL
ncbi:MAG: hypothetical protein GXO02_05580 [Epsilonproteobacteria bacterium]|nr:hypothetical protein [Campylobacterota bacterium]